MRRFLAQLRNKNWKMNKAGDFIVKILSLGVGLAISLILVCKVNFELSYDSAYSDVDRIFRIRTAYSMQGEDKDFYQVSGGVAPGFKAEIPGVVSATRYTMTFDSKNVYDEEGNCLKAEIAFADSCLFDVFDRKVIAGDPVAAMKNWDGSVAVSESLADALGGPQNALGKMIYNDERPDLKLTVVGVFEDFPKNGSINYDVVASIGAFGQRSLENWVGNDRYVAYVRLAPGVAPESLAEPIRKMQEAHQPLEEMEQNGMSMRYYLEPMRAMHTSDVQVRNMILILSIVAALLLLVSVMNYVLISIGDVVRRSKEVGVRKCFGAGKGSIYALLFKETAVNLAASLAVGVLIVFACRPLIVQLLGVEVKDLLLPQSVAIVAAIVVIVFLVSAVIPARMFIRIPVSSAFRGYKDSKRRWKLSLLAFQFVIAAVLAPMLSVVSAQYDRSLKSDLGYSYDNLVYARISNLDPEKMALVADNLRKLSCVEGAELTYTLPLEGSSGNNVTLPGDDRQLFNIADQYGATQGFFDLMGFKLIEGAAPSNPGEVAVSRRFAEKLLEFASWDDGVVGKTVDITDHDAVTICGVYEDYVIGSNESSDPRPSARFCWGLEFGASDRNWTDAMNTVVVKLTEKNSGNVALAEKAINEIVTSSSADARDVELTDYSETVRKLYSDTDSMRRTFAIGSIFAIIIALVGLIGYVRDENYRRSKEISIRLVNGAEPSSILAMLTMGVLRIAVVCMVIGNVGAWFVASSWLEKFPNAVTLSAWHFILPDLAVLVIIGLSVIMNTIKISRSNPVDNLKQE